MKTKKVPMRMCVLTHEKLNGKGCYLKKDKEIIEEARKKKVLNHIFNMDVSDDVYENLKELV